jgi:hypothetical protein
MTRPVEERDVVRRLIDRLAREGGRPRDVFAEARAIWLSGAWPSPGEDGYDPIAHDVLFMLADAREMGVNHEDAPALRAYLDAAEDDPEMARTRLFEHVMSVDSSAREALQESDFYYGPRSPTPDEDRSKIAFPNPEMRRLHEGVRLDPESVWVDLRAFLCAARDPFDNNVVDLVEDLMFWHADDFVDRLEQLVDECPAVRLTVAWAQVGGVAGPGIDRFELLHQRLVEEAMAEGLIR